MKHHIPFLTLTMTSQSHSYVSQREIKEHPAYRIINAQDAYSIYEAALVYGHDFNCSTSGWDSKHIRALRVLLFEGLPMDRIRPASYAISPTSALAMKVSNAFKISSSDIKMGRYSMDSITSWFFDELANLLRTDKKTPSPIIAPTKPKRSLAPSVYVSPPNRDPDSILGMAFSEDSQGSSYLPPKSPSRQRNQEEIDVREVVTNNMIIAFMSILSNMAYPERNPTQPRPMFNAKPDSIRFILNGHHLSSANDGSGWKTRFSQGEKQWVLTGGAPLLTLEVHHQLLDFLIE
jgi:hypothetical protein